MNIKAEIQSLSPAALVELFELDLTMFNSGVMYFHAGSNEVTGGIVWQGKTYQALPVEAEGFEITTQGTLPRPKLKVANIQGLFSSAIDAFDDLVGCKVTRRRTFARYLDAVNFPDGKNMEADPNQFLPDEVWYIEQKTSENRYIIEWE
ncbi:phage minor tail protein L, partial [Oxalobacter sp. OttesenSCG-928-P03]|nr:phage minor tail protein L [Oxalobacter sp. OttesenSCG-928-P03]